MEGLQLRLRRLKAPHFVIFVFVLFFASLAFYCFCFWNRTETDVMPKLLKDQSISDEKRLGKLLRRASMPDNSVIVTIVNQEWASPGSVLELFLESFRVGHGIKNLLDHIVIFSVDGAAHEYCKSIHPRCFNLANYRINYANWKQFKNLHHLKLGWRKVEILGEVLELGYNVLFTDVDVLWLRNPFQQFESYNVEIITARNDSQRKIADVGFVYLRSDEALVEFFKYWKLNRVLYPNTSAQSIFEMIKEDEFVEMMGLRIKYLDTYIFRSLCEPTKNIKNICTLHAKCFGSVERKVYYLRHTLDLLKNLKWIGSSSAKNLSLL